MIQFEKWKLNVDQKAGPLAKLRDRGVAISNLFNQCLQSSGGIRWAKLAGSDTILFRMSVVVRNEPCLGTADDIVILVQGD